MDAARFDEARIREFLSLAGERLDGDWLLVGGAAAATWFSPSRTTEDVDLIGMAGALGERLALMELAVAASLPVEAVNSAADFFVRRISDWRDHLEVLHRGGRATIYRPDATLFLLLKINRLSETDLEDCLRLIDHCEAEGTAIDRKRVVSSLDVVPATDDVAAVKRRAAVRVRLTS